MRAAAYLVMVLLIAGSIAAGEIAIALLVGGIKTLIVGLEFMELRQAARPHMIVFSLGAVALTALLVAFVGL